VRVVSTAVARTLREQYDVQIPITVLPIFVELQQFADARTPASLSDRFTRFKTKILVVARLEPEKNVALAIESFATVAPPDACLIIVGDGRERRMLEDLARSHNVSDRVFFEGEQASISYYSMVDLVLVTSHYEGYGLVIVEALASHKAVIATDVGIAREMGAIVADEQRFPHALAEWFKDGSRAMQLRDYPYKNFDEYVKAYCDDVSACIPEEKSLQ
jgi:glycosyltransferase involved in cell wall biosynthesis